MLVFKTTYQVFVINGPIQHREKNYTIDTGDDSHMTETIPPRERFRLSALHCIQLARAAEEFRVQLAEVDLHCAQGAPHRA